MSDQGCKVSRTVNQAELNHLYACEFPEVLCMPDVREFGVECTICNRSKGY